MVEAEDDQCKFDDKIEDENDDEYEGITCLIDGEYIFRGYTNFQRWGGDFLI